MVFVIALALEYFLGPRIINVNIPVVELLIISPTIPYVIGSGPHALRVVMVISGISTRTRGG
jgi:hypothetical protein